VSNFKVIGSLLILSEIGSSYSFTSLLYLGERHNKLIIYKINHTCAHTREKEFLLGGLGSP
jgi:hypothetical protein